MGLTAQCRICGFKVPIKNEDVYCLGEHLIKKHPEVSMTHFSFENNNGSKGRKPLSTAKRKYLDTLSLVVNSSS